MNQTDTLTITSTDEIDSRLSEVRDALVALSHDIHAHPEPAFEEHHASSAVADLLEEHGFDVERGAYGLDTAVAARLGDGDLHVVIAAEYDALPEIGHACGHNMIAAAGVGAALAIAPLIDRLGLRVTVLGTPAEEGGGGKVLLLRRGAWDDADFSMMVHPTGDFAGGADLACGSFASQGVDRFRVTYRGAAAHAAGTPWRGVNAANAVTIAEVSIGLLRQQLPDRVRTAAIVRHGGDAVNVIPERAELEVEVRSPDLSELDDVRAKIVRCLEAGALATGCDLEIEPIGIRYEPLAQDEALSRLWNTRMPETGRRIVSPPGIVGGSTDMGNVTRYLPAIHPTVAVLGSPNMSHSPAFTEDTAGPAADRAIMDAARTIANVIADTAADDDLRADLQQRRATREPYAPS